MAGVGHFRRCRCIHITVGGTQQPDANRAAAVPSAIFFRVRFGAGERYTVRPQLRAKSSGLLPSERRASILKPTFFESPAAFRNWLEKNHDKAAELLVGFYKKGSGKPSMTWQESVDQALCFGWIDGVRRRIDDASYSIRFTPRRKESIWSAVNIRRATELTNLGSMCPAGVRAFELRDEEKSRIYSYERESAAFSPALEKEFRANKKAWRFFNEQPPGYRRIATHYVMSAKQEETRQRRLARLIKDSERARQIGVITSQRKKK